VAEVNEPWEADVVVEEPESESKVIQVKRKKYFRPCDEKFVAWDLESMRMRERKIVVFTGFLTFPQRARATSRAPHALKLTVTRSIQWHGALSISVNFRISNVSA